MLPRWWETYDAIKEMHSHIIAPVDTMGCDQAQLKEMNLKVSLHLVIKNPLGGRQNQCFSTLVSLMLSSQTKDEVTDAAVSNLREVVEGSLSVDAMLAAEEDTISEAIGKVGFWRRKTQSVYSCIVIMHRTPVVSYHTDTSSERLKSFMMTLIPTCRKRLMIYARYQVLDPRWHCWPSRLRGTCSQSSLLLPLPID
jgi:endonuclease III